MATGTGIQGAQPITTSDITPSINLPSNQGFFDTLGDAAATIDKFGTALLKDHYAEQGAKDGAARAAGDLSKEPGIVLTEVGAARQQAFEAAYRAGTSNDLDAQEGQARLDFSLDPEGYKKQMDRIRSGAVQNAPGKFAVWTENYANAKAADGLLAVSGAAQAMHLKTAKSTVLDRNETLDGQLTAALHEGGLAALENPSVKAMLDERAANSATLTGNPAFGISQELAKADLDKLYAKIKATGAAADIVKNAKALGYNEASRQILTMVDDPALPLTTEERRLAVALSAHDLEAMQSADDRARRELIEGRSDAERQIRDMIDDDIGHTRLTGKGTGLTQEEVMKSPGGWKVAADWLAKKSDALADYRQFGDLSRLSPEEAASRMLAAGQVATLPATIGTPRELDVVLDAQRIVETAGNPAQVSEKGAVGAYQVIPTTARRIAAKLGLPYDAGRLLNDPAYNRQIARGYMTELLDRYQGDPFLAVTAYHAGQKNVDGWINNYGDPRATGDRGAWLAKINAAGNPRSAAYPAKVAAAMSGGRAAEAWDRSQALRQADPVSAVADAFPVKAAADQWAADAAAGKPYSGAAFGYVSATLRAQQRAGIKPRDQQPLTRQQAQHFVDQVHTFERRGDVAAYQAWVRDLNKVFRDPTSPNSQGYGPRVLQAVLSQAGSSDFAARVGASITSAATTGQRPPPGDVAQVGAANRVEAQHRAATGTTQAQSVPSQAAAYLKAHPNLADQFEAKYGRGSAARVLEH